MPTAVRVVCSNFNVAITSSRTLKFGFWTVNPSSTTGLAIPVEIYAYNQVTDRKFVYTILEAGIRILPVAVTPITDLGNFVAGTTERERISQNF